MKRITDIKTRFVLSVVGIYLFFLLSISTAVTQLTDSILSSVSNTSRLGLSVSFIDFAVQKGLILLSLFSLAPFVLILPVVVAYSVRYHYSRFASQLLK